MIFRLRGARFCCRCPVGHPVSGWLGRQLRRSCFWPLQNVINKRLMLAQTTPTFGDVEHGRAAAVAQNRPADEDGGSQRGGSLEARLVALLRGTGVLIKAQQVVGEAHAQERTLGGVKVLHA